MPEFTSGEMSENRTQLLKMVQRYIAGEATAEEQQFLEAYYAFWEHEEGVLDQLLLEEKWLLEEQMLANIRAGIEPEEKNNRRHLWSTRLKISAAAALLCFCVAGAYLLIHKKSRQLIAVKQNDLPPGTNKAILTLADGQKINLDDAKSGQLASQAGISITKSANGELVYTVAKNPSSEASAATNTIETPKGGQYQVRLPDGTHVWLNAASSLTYPTTFSSAERKVSLTGEGYFEVAGNAKKPFLIEVDGQTEVKVLGTQFNINAYPEEKTMNTTLVEGAVLLRSKNRSARLVPGQQGQIDKGGDPIALVDHVDLDQVMAWKNGFFSTGEASLEMIMRQVERWYDVKVVYKEAVEAEFVAKLPRDLPLSKLLQLLELTKQVHFKVDGNRVEVMK